MIEVNEYVRLARNQGINKIIDKEDDRYILESEIADSYGDITWFLYECELKEDIVKHSKQLIDLIEVGDIVNKELVIGIIDITNNKEEIIGRKLITQYRSAQFTGLDIKHYIYANDIKTILTKESYIANCYKVGGEK